MSLRTTRGLLLASSLALGFAAVGCGDDDKTPVGGDDMDAGTDGGKPDATTKADATVMANGNMMCGTEMCTGIEIVGTPIGACCTPTNGCGLNADDIKKISPQSQFTGCIPKDTPAASPSTHCGAFFDQVEPDPMGSAEVIAAAHSNGGLDVAGSIPLVFDGCCLDTGECGAMLSAPRGEAGKTINLHFGCVSLTALQSSLGSGMSSRPAPTLAPYCSPTTGNVECPAKMGLLCANLKAQFAAKGLTFDCTADTAMPSWACVLAKLPRNDMPVTVTEACFEGLPGAAQGCGEMVAEAPMGSSCIPGLPANKFGCNAIPSGPVVPSAPKFICGCGVGNASTDPNRPCIPNSKTDVCGSAEPTATQLAAVPEFMCGCGETVAQTVDGQPSKLCLSYLPATTCGTKEIEAGAPELAAVPAFICGADGNPDTTLPKLRGVNVAVCGTKPITAASTELAAVPEILCGCTGRTDPKLGCLRNVANDVCGKAPVTAASTDILVKIPKFFCGCGATTIENDVTAFCLSNVETDVCGTRPDATTDVGVVGNAADDCLTGVPEYARGCGAIETPAGQSCLRQTPTLFGCDSVTAGPIRRLPEYLCGCGDVANQVATGLGDNALPCLPQVPTSICGAIPITASNQVNPLLSNRLCGCGDGTNTNAAMCLDNVPPSVCGGKAECVASSCGTMCLDLFGGEGSLPGGQGGTGDDGILDTCAP